LALSYWKWEEIEERLVYFIHEEAIICEGLPFRAAVHRFLLSSILAYSFY
jgi:hypothetical protein